MQRMCEHASTIASGLDWICRNWLPVDLSIFGFDSVHTHTMADCNVHCYQLNSTGVKNRRQNKQNSNDNSHIEFHSCLAAERITERSLAAIVLCEIEAGSIHLFIFVVINTERKMKREKKLCI